ncbi:hypothetical protein KIPB_010633 [Kipferlia bialata]|uniref:Uncharacterized protein n=1 Tax=Kipferlia bialata TaxID=797122 RepID=A0A9K3GMG9_9EUKA|nr:hypothetical protein KIPB_010633 [Kipferlia bialata]|eukprot:g10633.t1
MVEKTHCSEDKSSPRSGRGRKMPRKSRNNAEVVEFLQDLEPGTRICVTATHPAKGRISFEGLAANILGRTCPSLVHQVRNHGQSKLSLVQAHQVPVPQAHRAGLNRGQEQVAEREGPGCVRQFPLRSVVGVALAGVSGGGGEAEAEAEAEGHTPSETGTDGTDVTDGTDGTGVPQSGCVGVGGGSDDTPACACGPSPRGVTRCGSSALFQERPLPSHRSMPDLARGHRVRSHSVSAAVSDTGHPHSACEGGPLDRVQEHREVRRDILRMSFGRKPERGKRSSVSGGIRALGLDLATPGMPQCVLLYTYVLQYIHEALRVAMD